MLVEQYNKFMKMRYKCNTINKKKNKTNELSNRLICFK